MAQKEGTKRPNIFKRIGAWLAKSWSELKNVNWPTFPEVLKNLGVVLVIVGLFLLVISLIDVGLLELFQLLTNTGATGT